MSLPAVVALEREMQRAGVDFVCRTELPTSSAQVEFLGPFLGEVVAWQMELATLNHWRNTCGMAEVNAPFIEIGPGINGAFPVKVGLDLPQIDTPALKKTIVMLRKYKRLRAGRMYFGE